MIPKTEQIQASLGFSGAGWQPKRQLCFARQTSRLCREADKARCVAVLR